LKNIDTGVNDEEGSARPSFSLWLDGVRQERAAEAAKIRESHFSGAGGMAVVRAYTALTDHVVKGVFERACDEAGVSHKGSGWVLAAVGGYGRGELNPYSDVDIMFIRRAAVSGREKDGGVPTRALHMLWDLGMDLGYSVRGIDDCCTLAKKDLTIMTSLLEARRICGDTDVFEAFKAKMGEGRKPRAVEEYVREKLGERARRHKKFGDSVFLREPNLKEGAGGLRDIHAAFWIAKMKYGVDSLEGLAGVGLVKEGDARRLRRSKDYLLRLRNEVHYLSEHKQDVLTFEHQESAAADFGYTPRPNRMAVENFMRAYYIRARGVSEITQGIIEKALEQKKRASWFSLPVSRKRVDDDFYVMGRSLCMEKEAMDALKARPRLIISAFSLSHSLGLPMSEVLREAIADNVRAVDSRFRESNEGGKAFLDIIGRPEGLYETLDLMHGSKVLGRFLPEFGAVSALVQHDLYHKYTVDEHSLLAVKKLQGLLGGQGMAYPELREAFVKVGDRQALFLAALFHDTGKAKGPGHAEQGARLVRQAALRLGMDTAGVDATEFLVRNHLLMAQISQRRELSDRKVIEKFCRIIGSPEYLDMLYLITYADVSAVGPELFNDWKRMLLKELYERASAFLKDEVSVIAYDRERQARMREAAVAEAVTGGVGTKQDVERFLDNMPPRYLLSVPVEGAVRHFRLSRELKPGGMVMDHVHDERGYTELTIMLHEEMGIFHKTAGALAARGMNILSAQIFTGRDGIVVDTLQVTDYNKRPAKDDKLWADIKTGLVKALTGRARVSDMLPSRPAYPRRTALRDVPVKVVVDNEASDRFTVVEVYAPDRVGLLYDITRVLYQSGWYISSARVDTEVDQVVDVFYVADIFRQKIDDPDKIGALKEALTAAVGGAGA